MESLVDQGSDIEGAQQSASSIGSVAFESNRPNINGADSENIVQDHPSPSCKYFNERTQLSYTKSRDEEKSHDQSSRSIDESQHSVEGKVVQQYQAPFYEEKSSWADPIMHPEGGTVDREGVSNSGEAIDKDKLISLLEDEVHSSLHSVSCSYIALLRLCSIEV